MKLADIIPARIESQAGPNYAYGWNCALDGVAAAAETLEAAGYVLVLQAELDSLRAAAQREAA